MSRPLRSCVPLALLVLVLAPGVARPAAPAAADLAALTVRAAGPAPSDTGLFAPVARQVRAREAEIARARLDRGQRDRLARLLLENGRVDSAIAVLEGVTPRGAPLARALLVRQDYARARPLVEAILQGGAENDAERRVVFGWLFARDDAAEVDRMTRGRSLLPGTTAPVPDLLAAGRLAYDLMQWARAESCYTRAMERTADAAAGATRMADDGGAALGAHAEALAGLGRVRYKQRDYDGSLTRLAAAVTLDASPDALESLGETLIRLGRTDEAISANQWAVRLGPNHEIAHYFLGNGYARKNYTELAAAYPGAFADATGHRTLARGDSLRARGGRTAARAAYERLRAAHRGWADVPMRLAAMAFEDGAYERARDLAFEALAICPEYGRAHAILAKALESQRFVVDVHRAGYERRFAAAPFPDVPGIETFVLNWRALSPRHKKRVALSIAPWKQFLPVLVAGGATYYIKPLDQLLSETPGQEPLRDQRINYDSRLWDDVRGAGGYHTVTGIEDVERTIFDRYNTVLHELTHQVHAVLTADQNREIQELYRRAKERDDATKEGFLSRYAGGSVHEYFAEGANALESPKRDAYDPREVVRERLQKMDPDLEALVRRQFASRDVQASYPVAFVNAGDDRLERGRVEDAVRWYDRALARNRTEETALEARMRALFCGNRGERIATAADQALAAHPGSGSIAATAATALWHGGRGLERTIERVVQARAAVRPDDRWRVDLALGNLRWTAGDTAGARVAFDSVLAYQSDQPEGLWGKAAALALARRWDQAFALYDLAVRARTGVIDLRCDYARDLLRAGRRDAARAQLDEARLLEAEHPTAEALRGWLEMELDRPDQARRHARQALEWGPWCDLARIVLARVERRAGDETAARAALAPVRERIDRGMPPEFVYREKLAAWTPVHELPAVERELIEAIGRP